MRSSSDWINPVSLHGRGGEGLVEGRLGNHIQWQPVIHVSPDGRSARIRSRMMQQLNFGPRASMGASLYENEAVKEDGRWKFRIVHTFNTWTAGYDGGRVTSPGRTVPGPSSDYPPDGPPTFEFAMFPTVYDIPFHYRNPVTGRTVGTRVE